MSARESLPRITHVRPGSGYQLELTFTDGVCGVVDLTDWIAGKGGVFEALEDPGFFRRVSVNQELGTIHWPNDVDFCPDVLYAAVTGRPVTGTTGV